MRYDYEVSPLTPHTGSRVSLRRLPFITSLPMENMAPSGERFWSSYFTAVSLPIPSLSSFSSLILFSHAMHSLHHCCALCAVLVAASICTTAVVSGVRKILQYHDKQIRDKLIATHYLSTRAREKYSCIRQRYSNDGVMALVASLQRSVLRERSLLRCGLCTARAFGLVLSEGNRFTNGGLLSSYVDDAFFVSHPRLCPHASYYKYCPSCLRYAPQVFCGHVLFFEALVRPFLHRPLLIV